MQNRYYTTPKSNKEMSDFFSLLSIREYSIYLYICFLWRLIQTFSFSTFLSIYLSSFYVHIACLLCYSFCCCCCFLFHLNIFLIPYYCSRPLKIHLHTDIQIEVIYPFHWAIEVAGFSLPPSLNLSCKMFSSHKCVLLIW